jgi:hypothetical protein
MNRTSSRVGIALVAVGAVLLLRATGLLAFDWKTLFWVLLGVGGAVLVVRGFQRGTTARVFWGTLLFLGAVFELLRAVPQLDVTSYYTVPAFVLALGLAFVTAFICKPRSLPLLVGAVVFCLLAAGIWMVEFGFLYRYEVVSAVRDYWPVALILLGASLLIPRRTA